ncbi:MAG: hypothetical protein ABT11_08600 [Novosphingobium sp. SCN 66-18]|nr:MAG: hypothetical protein ABT11_08600 [Novosphingobium sp. SCN 66-18]
MKPKRVQDRFFFAVLPPDETAARIAAHARAMGLKHSLVTADRLHMTLAITDDFEKGECPPAYVETLLRAGERIAAAPFAMTLGKVAVGEKSILAQPAEGRAGGKAVYDCIAQAMAGMRAPLRDGGRYSPHMTLSYDTDVKSRGLRKLGFRWQVTEVVLIHSMVGLHRHVVLNRWPLVAPLQRQASFAF